MAEEKAGLIGKLFILVSVVFFIIFIIMVQISSSASLFLIILGFSPTILSCLLVIYLIEKSKKELLDFSWFFPVVFVIGFYLIGTNTAAMKKMEIPELSALNMLLSMAFISFLHLTGMSGKRMKKVVEPEKQMELEEYIQSIEDKCKALNFAIGRVYSNKHGSSPELRDIIKINKEHYNEFSDIQDFNNPRTRARLLELVKRIAEDLLILKRSEHDTLGGKMHHLKNIDRDQYGKDAVIDVLVRNDKDPVRTYFDSALQFCSKAMDELQK